MKALKMFLIKGISIETNTEDLVLKLNWPRTLLLAFLCSEQIYNQVLIRFTKPILLLYICMEDGMNLIKIVN